MNPALAQADRHQAIREVARSWHRAGLIDDHLRDVIEAEAPDDRRRLGIVMQAVAFAFASLATVAGVALVLMILDPRGEAVVGAILLASGALLLLITDVLKRLLRLSSAGVESATALLGTLVLVLGATWLIADVSGLADHRAIQVAYGLGAVAYAVVAFRWGSTVAALAATLLAALLLAQAPHARLAWTALAAVIAPVGLILGKLPRLPPSHRRSATGVAALATLGLYVAWHLGSWDVAFLESTLHVRSWPRPPRPSLPREIAIAATATIPVVVTTLGIATRRRALWALGVVLGVASLVTLRAYVHVAPLWVVLSAAGVALMATVLLLRRWLESGPAGERAGFSARPLSDEGQRFAIAEVAITAAVASAGARPTPETPRESALETGGGRSGGGGATGEL